MRRADGPDPQRISRNGIRAIGLGAGDLRAAIKSCDARAHRMALLRRSFGVNGATGRVLNRIDDLGIAGAAAKDAAQRILDHGAGWFCLAVQQCNRGHQHARRADAALCSTPRQKGLLQQRTTGQGLQALDGGDAGAIGLGGGHEAGAGGLTVDQHGAGAAVARVAAALGAHLSQLPAQHLAEAGGRGGIAADGRAIQLEGNHETPTARSSASPTAERAASRR